MENWEQEEWQRYMEEQGIRKEIQSKTDAFRTELQDFYQGDREAGEGSWNGQHSRTGKACSS